MTIKLLLSRFTASQRFMISVIFVNAGNYLYNLILGRLLGPELFSEAALLITLLLVLSFVAMTFQLATTKFSVLFEGNQFKSFINVMYRYATLAGILCAVGMVLFAKQLQQLMHTQSSIIFIIFGLGIPVYFLMSVNRGYYQGKKQFDRLAITYQSEMISRLVITLALLFVFRKNASTLIVSVGILCSFFFGLIPFKRSNISRSYTNVLTKEHKKHISTFFVITAFYELTQIIINNSDILLVKHYFSELDSGLYASLALIGRVVYFVTWMFVMLLLPAVIEKRKNGEATAPVLFKYIGYVTVLATAIVIGCFVFPEFIINIMFGNAYLSMADLLWQYAIATALFAIANIFAYYFLSLDHYIPIIVSGLLGISQIVLIMWFHETLAQVVHVQILAMSILCVFQFMYYLIKR